MTVRRRPRFSAELTAQERKFLDFLDQEIGLVFDHDINNLALIQQHMGWSPGVMRREFQNLSAKGYLRTIPQRKEAPRRWLVLKPDNDVPAPRCWDCGVRRQYTVGDCETCGAPTTAPRLPQRRAP